MRQLIDSKQLDQWFQPTSRDAQEILPHLLRRLIRATVPEATISIPVGDEITRPGYDGIVTSARNVSFVAVGTSVWEFGAGEPKAKFQLDYHKRTAAPGGVNPASTTFFFVTPHAWQSREAEAAVCRAHAVWRDVQILDSSDLASWLEHSPAVAVWLLGEFGAPLPDLEGLYDFRRRIAIGVRPALSDRLVIGGRTENLRFVHDWLMEGTSILFIDDVNFDAATAFACCALTSLPTSGAEAANSAVVVAKSAAAVDYLAGVGTGSLLVLPTTDEAATQIIMRASRTCRAIIPRGAESSADAPGETALRLDRVHRHEVAESLMEDGLAQTQADRIAAESKGHLDVVLRMLRTRGVLAEWEKGAEAKKLAPFVLIGTFLPGNDADVKIACEIAGCQESDFEEAIARWERPAGPFERDGNLLHVTGCEGVWRRLAPHFTRSLLKRFEEIASRELSKTDPTATMTQSQRIISQFDPSPIPSASWQLRRSLAASVTRFAMLDRAIGGVSGGLVADAVARKIFSPSNRGRGKFWASIAPFCEDLAEASPLPFLEAVESIADTSDALHFVFAEREMFGTSVHTHLLWALERLAWAPVYVSRVAVVLARLHVVDPGGKLGNRPLASLVSLFRPWLPGTAASFDERVLAFRHLLEKLPAVAWEVGVRLLPNDNSYASQPNRPKWQTWAEVVPERYTAAEFLMFVEEVVAELLRLAGTSGQRWTNLVEHLPAMTPDLRQRVVDDLATSNPSDWPEADQSTLQEALRKLVAGHRRHAEAHWALPATEVDRLEQLRERFTPVNIVSRNAWLFTNNSQVAVSSKMTWDEQRAQATSMQDVALREVIAVGGVEGIKELAMHADQTIVGWTLLRVADEQMVQLVIEAGLRDGPNLPLAQIAQAVVSTTFQTRGGPWFDQLVQGHSGWDDSARIRLALAMPPMSGAWSIIDGWGTEVSRHYWAEARLHWVSDEDVPTAIARLLLVKRGTAAIHLAGELAYPQEIDRLAAVTMDDIVRLLRDGPFDDLARHVSELRGGEFGHLIAYLIDLVERRGADQQTLAGLEWTWIEMLEYTHRRLTSFEAEVSRDPRLFVQLVSAVYRPKGGKIDSEADFPPGMGQRAYRILSKLTAVPGCTYSASNSDSEVAPVDGDIVYRVGSVDEASFRTWIEIARTEAAVTDRAECCDAQIGELLAFSPGDSDGSWPAAPIRRMIDEVASESLENGLSVGIFNRRGCHFVQPKGQQEDQLARKFGEAADRIAIDTPRTSAVLRSLSHGYLDQAEQNRSREKFEEFRDP